jgi:hypothetical protein
VRLGGVEKNRHRRFAVSKTVKSSAKRFHHNIKHGIGLPYLDTDRLKYVVLNNAELLSESFSIRWLSHF